MASDKSEIQTSLSQWAHTHKKHIMSKPFENAGWNQKAGRNLRSTACREIIVLKEAKSKTKRKNYLQKQSYHYKKQRKIVWQYSNLLFSQAVSGTAMTGAHPTN